MKFFIIFKKLSQHMILVNISQQKVNTRSTHGQYHPTYQNVQNFINKMNLVNIWFFGQQKLNITQHIKIFVFSTMVGGWENSNIKFSQKILSKYKLYQVFSKFLSSQPWWVGGRIKISSFPKRFYQNINYIKFFQKLLSKVGTGIGPYGPSLCARFIIFSL